MVYLSLDSAKLLSRSGGFRGGMGGDAPPPHQSKHNVHMNNT